MAGENEKLSSEAARLQEGTHLVRVVEAALKVDVPDAEELRFRASLLNCAAASIRTMKPGLVIRLYGAACEVKFPSETVTLFRHALQREIGAFMGLRNYRLGPVGGKG